MSIVVVAHWRAREGEQQRLAELLPGLSAACLAEPGCLAYRVSRNRSDDRSFVLFEEYADAAAVEAHRGSDHFRTTVLETALPLLEDRTVALYEPL